MKAAVEHGGGLLRRLLPFPSSSDDASSLQIPIGQLSKRLAPPDLATGAVAPVTGQSAATIVSEAAAILDEEMARGVLAARGVSQPSDHRDADQSRTVLRQLHDVIDQIAQIWPTLPTTSPAASAPPPNASNDDALPSLRPAFVLRPGQRGTISMTLCNNEDRVVRLVPTSTDLISSGGGRMSGQLFEFAPAELQLAPGEQKEVQGRITVPLESALGCYLGLWVVTGVEYLRALITVEVG